MMKKIFIATMFISLLAFPIIFVYLSFASSIDCDQLVIDTYELHSKIDIPKVEFVNCYYDEELNTRISIYDIKDELDLNKFKKATTTYKDFLLGEKLLNDEELPKGSNLYVASGKRWGTMWTYAVDLESNRLWTELNY